MQIEPLFQDYLITYTPIIHTVVKDYYSVELKCMIGDADRYEAFNIYVDTEHDLLKLYVRLQERLEYQAKNWYDTCKDLDEWVNEMAKDYEEFDDGWPWDEMGDCKAAFRWIEALRLFKLDGTSYNVEIKSYSNFTYKQEFQ